MIIIYRINSHLKYDNRSGMPMTHKDADVVYDYYPQTVGYYFKRYGLRDLKNLCFTKRGAERRVRRLNRHST